MVDRHQRLLALLNERGHLSAGELARAFRVTPMTVWRDLRVLAELGLLRRVRGGARAVGAVAAEPTFEDKAGADTARKQAIARFAVERFVHPGSTIILEGGTTVAAMIPALPEAHISVFTNSLTVATQVRAVRPALPVRVTGGWLSPVSGNLTGPDALREIARLKADVCFLGATGFDAEVGPSDPNPLEIEVKRAWAAIARRTVLLIDASKFGRRAAAVTLHPRRLHTLITNRSPNAPIRQLLERENVRLEIASGA